MQQSICLTEMCLRGFRRKCVTRSKELNLIIDILLMEANNECAEQNS